MTNNNWKQLVRIDFMFNNLLKQIVKKEKVYKSCYMQMLQVSAKFELIRMESFGLIKFQENEIRLGELPDDLVEFYWEGRLQSAV